jgi:hypothetical protein
VTTPKSTPSSPYTWGILVWTWEVRPRAYAPKLTLENIDHNLRFDFSMTGDDGKELQPVFGEGLTGLRNLGNRLVDWFP